MTIVSGSWLRGWPAPAQLTTLLFLLTSTLALAAAPGVFGMSLTVKAGGWFLNPTIESLTVDSVTPGSPAALAHLAAGDEVLELDGHPVAGAKANDLKPLLHKAVGERLILRLRRKSGEVYSVTLVAIAVRE
jgi:C-terminal processing protease CtpA/Prc